MSRNIKIRPNITVYYSPDIEDLFYLHIKGRGYKRLSVERKKRLYKLYSFMKTQENGVLYSREFDRISKQVLEYRMLSDSTILKDLQILRKCKIIHICRGYSPREAVYRQIDKSLGDAEYVKSIYEDLAKEGACKDFAHNVD